MGKESMFNTLYNTVLNIKYFLLDVKDAMVEHFILVACVCCAVVAVVGLGYGTYTTYFEPHTTVVTICKAEHITDAISDKYVIYTPKGALRLQTTTNADDAILYEGITTPEVARVTTTGSSTTWELRVRNVTKLSDGPQRPHDCDKVMGL